MAQRLDDAGVAALPKSDYEKQVRSTLQSGDLLFCSGNYLVSRMIRQVTRSPWSHVGIIFRVAEIDRVLLLESVEDVGVRLAPLSKYLQNYEDGQPYDGPMVIARSSKVTSGTIAATITRFGADALTLPYDNKEIGEILSRVALGVGRKVNDDAYICSELVAACFKEAGIVIAGGPGDFVTPDDVWVDPGVQFLARVQ